MTDPSEPAVELAPPDDAAAPPAETPEEALERKQRRREEKELLRSRRGIETLFRVSYREQLELTALADSKANIMIEVNGLILSIMLASASIILDGAPWLGLPCGAMVVTAFISIVFAVLAARPTLREPAELHVEDVQSGRANILYFGNFARISEDQFVDGMREMLDDPERVYLNMTRHIYGMGFILRRKFRLLRVAYTVFLTGLFVTSALLLFALYTQTVPPPAPAHPTTEQDR